MAMNYYTSTHTSSVAMVCGDCGATVAFYRTPSLLCYGV